MEPRQMMNWRPETFLLLDQLEYAPGGAGRPIDVEALGWYGGAYNRLWVRARGEQLTADPDGEGEVEVLYGRLVRPFWDAVVGARVDRRWGDGGATRALLAAGLQGVATYRFEVAPTLYLSQDGDLSARFEASYSVLVTQRLIAEPKVELNAALQEVPRFGVGRGLNDYELGLRTRYEFRREFAPYVGYSWSRRVGATADLAREAGEGVSGNRFVAGVRVWY
jgi:copper resistance protein B